MPRRWSIHYGYWIVAISAVLMGGALGFGRFAYALVLPAMKQGLGLSYTETGLLQTGSFASYTIALLAAGAAAHRVGLPRLAALSLLLVGLSTALTGLARGFGDALAMRLLTGVGTAGVYVPVTALTASWFVSSRRGVASGIVVGGMGIGIVISGWMVPPILAGAGDVGWRISWAALGLPVAALALAAARLLQTSPAERGLAPIGGAGPDRPPIKPPSLSIYRWWPIWQLGIVYLFYGIAYSGYITFFTAYATTEGGLSIGEAGVLWATIGILSIASGPAWGQISDRIGRGPALAVTLAIQTVAFGLIAVWINPAGLIASAVLYGLSAWSVPSVMTAACGDFAGQKQAASAIGLIVAIHSIGLILGPSSFGLIGDHFRTLAPALGMAAGLDVLAAAFLIGIPRSPTEPAGEARRRLSEQQE